MDTLPKELPVSKDLSNQRDQIIDHHRKLLKSLGLNVNSPLKSSYLKTFYSPKSIVNMKQLQIQHLQEGKTLTGYYLKGKIILQSCLKEGAMHAIIEDSNQHVVSVMFLHFLIPSEQDYDDIFTVGREVNILNPTLKKINTIPTLVVDSSEDVVFQDEFAYFESKTAEELKTEGNTAHQANQYQKAVVFYSQGIFRKPDSKLEAILHSNKAASLHSMKRFEASLESAKAAVQVFPEYMKGTFKMVLAKLELGQYSSAGEDIANLQGKIPEVDYKMLVETHKKFLENSTGKYNWGKLLALSRDDTDVDIANYTNDKLSVKPSSQASGVGIFTSENLERGELLVVSKPFAYVTRKDLPNQGEYENEEEEEENKMEEGEEKRILFQKVYFMCLQDKHRKDELMQLDDSISDLESRKKKATTINYINPQTLSNIVGKDSMESFGFTDGGVPKSKSGKILADFKNQGLWIYPSFLNHSCVPNVSNFFLGPVMVIRANQDIKAGSELFISYVDTFLPVMVRQDDLKKYGFQCKCKKCVTETEKLSDTMEEAEAANRFLEIYGGMSTDKSVIQHQIGKLETIYENAPISKMRLLGPKLLIAYARCGLWDRYSQFCISYFESLPKDELMDFYVLLTGIHSYCQLSYHKKVEHARIKENVRRIFQSLVSKDEADFEFVLKQKFISLLHKE
jgi:tetratricopeptide (TPR) repeat protein